jgi:hypothetical protein
VTSEEFQQAIRHRQEVEGKSSTSAGTPFCVVWPLGANVNGFGSKNDRLESLSYISGYLHRALELHPEM